VLGKQASSCSLQGIVLELPKDVRFPIQLFFANNQIETVSDCAQLSEEDLIRAFESPDFEQKHREALCTLVSRANCVLDDPDQFYTIVGREDAVVVDENDADADEDTQLLSLERPLGEEEERRLVDGGTGETPRRVAASSDDEGVTLSSKIQCSRPWRACWLSTCLLLLALASIGYYHYHVAPGPAAMRADEPANREPGDEPIAAKQAATSLPSQKTGVAAESPPRRH